MSVQDCTSCESILKATIDLLYFYFAQRGFTQHQLSKSVTLAEV